MDTKNKYFIILVKSNLVKLVSVHWFNNTFLNLVRTALRSTNLIIQKFAIGIVNSVTIASPNLLLVVLDAALKAMKSLVS